MKILRVCSGLFVAIALLTSCATQRINQFSTFADAGKDYSDAVIVLTDQASRAAIDADSAVLLQARKKSKEDRIQQIGDHTKSLEDLIKAMRVLREHTLLLKRYFHALGKLAGSDAPSRIGDQATNLVAALQTINPKLKGAKFGNAPVEDFIGQAVPIVVAQFQQKALEDELKKNGKTIERELDLQKAALTALTQGMVEDLKIILKLKRFAAVEKPFVFAPKLPKNWMETRQRVLSGYIALSSAKDAAVASKKLHSTFVALVKNEIEPGDFDNLFADINAIITLTELVKKTN